MKSEAEQSDSRGEEGSTFSQVLKRARPTRWRILEPSRKNTSRPGGPEQNGGPVEGDGNTE